MVVRRSPGFCWKVKHRKTTTTLKWLRSINKVVKALDPYLMCMNVPREHTSRGSGAANNGQGCKVFWQLRRSRELKYLLILHRRTKKRMFLGEPGWMSLPTGFPIWNLNFSSLWFFPLTLVIAQMLLNKTAQVSVNDGMGAGEGLSR